MNIKKVLAAVSAAVTAVLPLAGAGNTAYDSAVTVSAAEERALGDVNADGKVDGKDASRVLAEYSLLSTKGESAFTDAERIAGDVDTDSSVSAKDASYILSFYSFLSTGGQGDIRTFMNGGSEPVTTTSTSEQTTTSATVLSTTYTTSVSAETTTAASTTAPSSRLSRPYVTTSFISDTSVQLTWREVSGADMYRLEVSTDPDFKSISIISTFTTNYYTLSKMTPGKTYYVRVRAQDSSGDELTASEYALVEFTVPGAGTTSTTTSAKPATTTTSTQTTSAETTAPTTTTTAVVYTSDLAKPDVSQYIDAENAVHIWWVKNEGADNYLVEFSTDPDFKTIQNKLTATNTSVKVSKLVPGRTYYARVRAQKSSGDGDALLVSEYSYITFVGPSESAETTETTTTTSTTTEQTTTTAAPETTTTTTATIRVVSPLLSAPTVSLDFTSTTSVRFTWDKVEGAEQYVLEFSSKSDFSSINGTAKTSTNSYERKYLTPGSTYYMRICAQKKGTGELLVSPYTTAEFTMPKEIVVSTATTTTPKVTTTTKATTTAKVTTTASTTTTSPVTVARNYSWTDPNTGKKVGYTLTFKKAVADHYSTIPRIKEINKWTEYCSDEVNKSLLKEFADWVNKTGDSYGYSDYQKVLLAAQVAQKIPYKTDKESRYVAEYPKYPYETFYDGCGDCEDKSIILAGILHEMNYGVALLHFSDHMAVGISGGNGIYGRYYTLSGSDKKYFYIESTNFGAKIGECPEKYKDEIPRVYILKF
ncbi:MAG: fibronectin type III domain-containing protein [Ruminococcus sp.]|nr:fibronectin type III domain-containing protein [Ruminococcus sp.]